MNYAAALAEPLIVSVLFALACAACLLVDRRRSPRPGYCRVCDYDLRASKYRCPECGTAVPKDEIPAR